MFAKLFAESGLSLDRLRALVEVGAHGSIVRAAGTDPTRQSQYSRQIKELEDFFQTTLVERHGKGVRLTARGRELARISRFFLLGLANFQRGCLAEGQRYRIGAGATFIATFLLPFLAERRPTQPAVRFNVETAAGEDIERRLHDLTLDFGVVVQPALSRPLQLKELGRWRLRLWVPKALCATDRQAVRAFREHRLPLAWPTAELPLPSAGGGADFEPALACSNFLEAKLALAQQTLATFLPDFLAPGPDARKFLTPAVPLMEDEFCYRLAWNPRLLRLNPHAARRRDALIEGLARRLTRAS